MQNKGQSTVEYLLLITAVVVVVILFTTGHGQGGLQQGLNSTFNQATQGILCAEAHLVNASTGN